MNQACTVAEENENIVCNAKNHIVIKSVSSSFDKKARLNTQNQSMYEKIIRRQSLAQQNSRPVLLLKKDFLNCKANGIQEEKNQNQPFLEQVAEDPQFVPEYVGTCIKYMIQRENKKMVSLQKLQRCQKYVHQREEIVDWICCLHNSMGLAEEIFPIAINFLDRFLSETTDSSEDIELIALTCLFMASKLEQTFGNVSINFFISVSGLDQSVDSLLAMEDKIVNALQFQLIYDTPHKYFQLFARIADLSHKNKYLGQFFIELALTHIKSCGFSASKMAASALYSIHKLRKVVPAWPSSLQSLTGYKESDFVDCVRFLSILMHENYGQFGTKIRSKFSKESKCSVSNIKLYRKIQ